MDKTVPQGRVKGTLTPPCSKSYAQRALAAALLTEGGVVPAQPRILRRHPCGPALHRKQLGASVRGADGGTVTIRGGLRPRGSILRVGGVGALDTALHPHCGALRHARHHRRRRDAFKPPDAHDDRPAAGAGRRDRGHRRAAALRVRGPIRGGEVAVDGSVSSQFITGLLLALPRAERDTTLYVRRAVSTPYLDMTLATAARFGVEISQRDYEEFYIPGGQRYEPADFAIICSPLYSRKILPPDQCLQFTGQASISKKLMTSKVDAFSK